MAETLQAGFMSSCAAWKKMQLAGLEPFVDSILEDKQCDGAPCLRGFMLPGVVARLEIDKRFAHGPFYKLHEDVGSNLIDFRSYSTDLDGHGSLQIVIDKRTGKFYADVDAQNPYQDLVGVFGHMFGEVVPDFVKGWFHRKKKP